MDVKRIEVVSDENFKKRMAALLDPQGVFQLVHRSRHGELIDITEWRNLVTNEGKNYILDAAFNTTALTSVTDAWYFAIFAGAYTPAAGSTYASPGGTENTNYTETLRQAWGAGAASSQAVTNASAATITADTGGITVTGIGVVGSPTEQTGGTTGDIDYPGDTSCSDGVLLSEATVSKTLAVSETLDITYTISC
jgi:hypothetical protein